MEHKLPLSDTDIRPPLKIRLMSSHRNEPDTVILDELGLRRGEARVDVAIVNGSVHGYEIKSDRDSLQRLTGQIELYGKVLDHATLVVGGRHLDKAVKILPEWWGVIHVEAARCGPRFKIIRRAKKNPGRDARVLAELLWLDDAISLLAQHGLDRGVRGKPRRIIWDRICEHLDIEVIASAVRVNLKARAKHLTAP